MADYAHTETDKRIEELEKRLQAEYRQAYRETKGKLEKYLSDFARKDEAKWKLVEKGELSQADYKKWRTNQMLTGQRWVKMVDTLAKDMNRTNQIAADIISGDLKGTFALNANFAAYGIENEFQTDFGFTLYNEDTVNRLIEENPDLLPAPRVDIPEDIRWNKQKITSNITQAVLQGKSIPEIAKTMQTVVGMNKASATRNARTAMTGAQNAGRQQAYDRAKAMGIKVKKEWVATLDGRTRHSHGKADGQQVEIDGKFKVGASELRYPGDPQGRPEEVYNCRCTMVTVEPDYILKGGEKPKSFEKWVEDKSTPAPKNKLVEVKTVEEAVKIANDLGVKYAQFEKMSLEQVNNVLNAVSTLPLDCRPKVIANGKDVATVTGKKLGRKADEWWGVTLDYRIFPLRTVQLGYDKTDYDGGMIVGLNTQKFKTIEALTKAKTDANKRYFDKTGHNWNFNLDGKATAYHEIGHCYADVRGLPKDWEKLSQKWAEEANCDLIKKPEEAFAEAWAAYHLGDERLPDYISDVIKELK